MSSPALTPREPIIALSTAPGVAALAVLRLSGADVRGLTEPLLDRPIAWQPGRVYYRNLLRHGAVLDDVVVTFWQSPHSYTGEDTVELSGHGNPHLVQQIVHEFLARGARLARPGEFTERALLNGKLSLTQAEGLLDLLHAPTQRALASAQAMKSGRLGQALEAIRTELIDLLSHLEASLDFAEEGIEPQVGAEFLVRIENVQARLRDLQNTATLGKILREGARVVLAGEPNVGKSSLLNALLREDRAIVAPTPGTTRDVIEAECNIRGLPVRLIDTAGQRQAGDPVEAEGVRRAQEMMARADLILEVIDAQAYDAKNPTQALLLPKGVPHLLVANKIDLGAFPHLPMHALQLSVQKNLGLDNLERAIEAALLRQSGGETSDGLTINARQSATLELAKQATHRAETCLRDQLGLEVVSLELREALAAMAEVIGTTTNEDILTQLFLNFCIGK